MVGKSSLRSHYNVNRYIVASRFVFFSCRYAVSLFVVATWSVVIHRRDNVNLNDVYVVSRSSLRGESLRRRFVAVVSRNDVNSRRYVVIASSLCRRHVCIRHAVSTWLPRCFFAVAPPPPKFGLGRRRVRLRMRRRSRGADLSIEKNEMKMKTLAV